MLIMQRTSIDFQGMADKIAIAFLEKGTPLEDGIVLEAKRRELKPEEVRRLVEKVNTTCSIKMMRSSEDKKRVFELASKDGVLDKTHPTDDLEDKSFEEDGSEKVASEFPVTRNIEKRAFLTGTAALASLYMPAMLGVAMYGGKKMRDITKATAAVNLAAKKEIADKAINRATLVIGAPVAAAAGMSALNDADEMSERSKESKKQQTKKASVPMTAREVFQLRNEIEKHQQDKVACEIKLQGVIDKLCHMKKAEFHASASDFLAANGGSTEAYLNSIASYIGLDEPFAKEAEFIDDSTEGYRLCCELSDGHATLVKLSSDIAEKKELLASVYAAIEEKSVI